MRVSSRDFLISNSNSGGHTLSNGFDLLKVEKRNRKLNRWGRKWCNLKIYEVVNYGILHNFYGQTVRIFYYSNSFKYFRVGEKVIFMIRSAFIQKLPQHWFSADSNRLYKKCSGRDPMLAWEREKKIGHILIGLDIRPRTHSHESKINEIQIPSHCTQCWANRTKGKIAWIYTGHM